MAQQTPQTIWITGASSGIGEALAYEYAHSNANLVLSARSVNKLEQVAQKCKALGAASTLVLPLDYADSSTFHESVQQVLKTYSVIHVLVNNGGISQRSLTHETDMQVYRKIMEVDFFGPIALTKAVLPIFKQQGFGAVAVVSSISGKFGFPLRSGYAAAKHALHGFFETLMLEERKNNIFVTIICPGRINTNISVSALTKDGNNHGQLDAGQANGMPVEVCAKQMKAAIANKRREVFIGRTELIMPFLKRFFPRIFYILATKINPK